MSVNPQNKCASLYAKEVDTSKVTLETIFETQRKLQDFLALKGRALDYGSASFTDRVKDVTTQWRNMNVEMAELLERLPWKEWKTYSDAQKSGFSSEEERLETLYEYIDVFHFLVNVGLALGVDGETFKRLYATKNAENFDRQHRGY